MIWHTYHLSFLNAAISCEVADFNVNLISYYVQFVWLLAGMHMGQTAHNALSGQFSIWFAPQEQHAALTKMNFGCSKEAIVCIMLIELAV